MKLPIKEKRKKGEREKVKGRRQISINLHTKKRVLKTEI